MIRLIRNMPPGTIGIEAVGKVTEDEDFESYSPGALWADTKLVAGHREGWKKVAIVSDADWLENSIKAFGWLMPGEVKVFETDEVDDAKKWLAGLDDDD